MGTPRMRAARRQSRVGWASATCKSREGELLCWYKHSGICTCICICICVCICTYTCTNTWHLRFIRALSGSNLRPRACRPLGHQGLTRALSLLPLSTTSIPATRQAPRAYLPLLSLRSQKQTPDVARRHRRRHQNTFLDLVLSLGFHVALRAFRVVTALFYPATPRVLRNV